MPEKDVIIRTIGDYNPVYTKVRPIKEGVATPPKIWVAIGKLNKENGKLIPNGKYWEIYHGSLVTTPFTPCYSTVRNVGQAFMLGAMSRQLGLTAALEESLGEKRSRLILTAALYMVTRGNIFDGVDHFCETHTLSEAALSSQGASRLFNSITFDDRMAFFKRWISKQPAVSYLAYDVTSFSTYAKGVLDSEFGYNRDGDRLPQINLGAFVSETTGLPVFYVTYPGSIIDKSHLPYMMAYNDELGITGVGFVLDRGFCSTANVRHLADGGYDFIIGVERRHKATRGAVHLAQSQVASIDQRIESGVFAWSFPGVFYGAKTTMHVYYDRKLADLKLDALVRAVDSQEEELRQKSRLTQSECKKYRGFFAIVLGADGGFSFERDMERIRRASLDCGYFRLLTNTGLGSAEVLATYRRKDVIEKCFDDVKNIEEMKRMRTHKTETTDGKIFCAFIALILASEIEVKLRRLMDEKSLSKAGLLREMEKIYVGVNDQGRRLLNPVTKMQRTIMNELGLTEDDLRAYIIADRSHSIAGCKK
jgi:transposase